MALVRTLYNKTRLCHDKSDTLSIAEFRGPGIHHRFDDSPDDYDMDPDQRTRMIGGGRSGSIILLRDGTEVLTDSTDADHDADMFDQSSDEEKDLESQVKKEDTSNDGGRGTRGETPGPNGLQDTKVEAADKEKAEDGATVDEPKLKAAVDKA